jgi:POT family proton-dependent oligopeptide transporter
MGINIGAFTAPLVVGWVQAKWGFHPAFAVAAFGMVISVAILWLFKRDVESTDRRSAAAATNSAHTAAVTEDAPPASVSQQGGGRTTDSTPGGMYASSAASSAAEMESIPESRRIIALIVIFAVVIVFWMVFHQNGSTLTYWANDNTNWNAFFSQESAENAGGIISNSINPFWVVTLTFPLVFFWGWLDRKGLEPSTPTKMAFGMTLTGLSFFVLFIAAKMGEATVTGGDPYAFKVSPLWLVFSYFIVTLGELMLSPMGLSLVSKVAPLRLRGLMMGGWFVATAVGNKLTMIGVYWERWLHSSFFLVLGCMALFMAVVLFLLLKPLKKSMPGV